MDTNNTTNEKKPTRRTGDGRAMARSRKKPGNRQGSKRHRAQTPIPGHAAIYDTQHRSTRGICYCFSSYISSIHMGLLQVRPNLKVVIRAKFAAGYLAVGKAFDPYALLRRYRSARGDIWPEPLANGNRGDSQRPSECSLVSENAGRSLDGVDLICLHALNVKHNLSLVKHWR